MIRSGRKTGPGRLRMIATSIASTSTSTSATTNMKTLIRKARRIFGKASAKTSPSKKASRIDGQPGDVPTRTASPPNTRIVLTSAIAIDRPPVPAPRIRDDRLPGPGTRGSTPGVPSGKDCSPAMAGRLALDHRRVGVVGEPLLTDLVERAVGLHLFQCQVHAVDERAPLLEGHREVLL